LAGDKKDEKEDNPRTAEEEAELAEQRREEEERRRNKYAKMEQERETVRQGIRDKVNFNRKLVGLPISNIKFYIILF
jgi:complexin-1/2